MRGGEHSTGAWGYRAFLPADLPPRDPPLDLGRLSRSISAADQALGRLDGAATTLPHPDLFVAMYVRREAVLSSQIEGTQASLTDVLRFEAEGDADAEGDTDVGEVINYIAAMNAGLDRLSTLPLSLRLIREIHARLMAGVRGDNKAPGDFRSIQNWIGPQGAALENATFVPPPPAAMLEALQRLETYLHDTTLPTLVHAGLCHAQFETIHPFLDGNGRVGRLLITFLLCVRGVLSRPLLYLSHYLKLHRQEYYDRLQATRTEGRWEEWLEFFLAGVAEVATEATATSRRILVLREEHQALIRGARGFSANLLRLHELLFRHPYCSAARVESLLNVSAATANSLIKKLGDLGVLEQTTVGRRNRKFVYRDYLLLFDDYRTSEK